LPEAKAASNPVRVAIERESIRERIGESPGESIAAAENCG
jgi:hypothetical protein